MSAKDRTAVEEGLQEIGVIRAEFRPKVQEQRDTLDELNATLDQLMQDLPLDANGRIERDKWSRLQAVETESLRNRTLHLRSAYRRQAGLAGPTKSGHWMCDAYASNWQILWLGFVAFVGAVGFVIWLIVLWDSATNKGASAEFQELTQAVRALADATNDSDKPKLQEAVAQSARSFIDASQRGGPPEDVVLGTVLLLGALGGILRLIASWVKYVGNRQLHTSWLAYYYFMPVQGALLASFIYMLLRVGILAPSAGAGSGTSQLNLLSIYVFAGLTGLFANDALDKLSEVFKTFAHTAKKDTIQPLRADGE